MQYIWYSRPRGSWLGLHLKLHIYLVIGNLIGFNHISSFQLFSLIHLRRQQTIMAIAGAQRKQVLKVLMISLLLDLVRNVDPLVPQPC